MRLDIQNNPVLRMKQIIKTDNAIKALLTSSPNEIDTWIDTNVNNVTDARLVFKKILKLLIPLVKMRLIKDDNDASNV